MSNLIHLGPWGKYYTFVDPEDFLKTGIANFDEVSEIHQYLEYAISNGFDKPYKFLGWAWAKSEYQEILQHIGLNMLAVVQSISGSKQFMYIDFELNTISVARYSQISKYLDEQIYES